MRIASFVNGFVAGLATLVAGGMVLASEYLVNRAGSWLSDFVVIEPKSFLPWWFVLATGVLMVVAASMTFERPLFALTGFGLAIVTAIVAYLSGASYAYIPAFPAALAIGLLLIPPKEWPARTP